MKSKKLIMLLAFGAALSACVKEPREGAGNLRLTFSGVDVSVTETATRSLQLTAPDIADFSLNIANEGETIDSWNSITEYPGGGYMLKVGEYTATVVCSDITQEGFGKPCFGVVKNFSIYNEVTTTVEIEASLLNMAATISYSDAFREYFEKGFSVVLTTHAGNEFDFDGDVTGALFMAPGEFGVDISYTRPNGSQGHSSFTVSENTEARKYFNITLDVNGGEVGSAAITVTFDDTMETLPIEVETGENS